MCTECGFYCKIQIFHSLTHLNSDKYDKFILSGIARMPIQDIIDSLKIYQAEPLEVREIVLKNKRFDDEGSYIVSFKHGTTKMNNLNKIKLNYTIPKRRIFQNRHYSM